ncbi:MAG TPA: hypothetical protein VI670_24295 [Thermoanaerobaculia bacterium]|jgi:hypothetical protein
MTDQTKKDETAVAAEPQAPQSPAITQYSQVAEKVSAMLSAAIAELGPLERPHQTTRDFVRANIGVDVKFVAAVIAAVETVPELQALKAKFDVAAAHDALQMFDAYDPIVAKLLALARELRFTLDARKAKVVSDARQIYAVAQRFARDPASEVTAHVEIMKRGLNRRRRSKTQAPQTPQKPETPPDTKTEGGAK